MSAEMSSVWTEEVECPTAIKLFACFGLIAQVTFKNTVTGRTQEQQACKNDQWRQIQRHEEYAPEMKTAMSSPEPHQNAKADINSDIQRGESWHMHVGRVVVDSVKESYTNVIEVTTVIRGARLK